MKNILVWRFEVRGDDALTRRCVMWHDSNPGAVFKSLVSLTLVKAGTLDPWEPEATAFVKPSRRAAKTEWLVRSFLPMSGPDLRPVELRWIGQPTHFGYAIPENKLQPSAVVIEPVYIDTTTVADAAAGRPSQRMLAGFKQRRIGQKSPHTARRIGTK